MDRLREFYMHRMAGSIHESLDPDKTLSIKDLEQMILDDPISPRLIHLQKGDSPFVLPLDLEDNHLEEMVDSYTQAEFRALGKFQHSGKSVDSENSGYEVFFTFRSSRNGNNHYEILILDDNRKEGYFIQVDGKDSQSLANYLKKHKGDDPLHLHLHSQSYSECISALQGCFDHDMIDSAGINRADKDRIYTDRDSFWIIADVAYRDQDDHGKKWLAEKAGEVYAIIGRYKQRNPSVCVILSTENERLNVRSPMDYARISGLLDQAYNTDKPVTIEIQNPNLETKRIIADLYEAISRRELRDMNATIL